MAGGGEMGPKFPDEKGLIARPQAMQPSKNSCHLLKTRYENLIKNRYEILI